MRNIKWPLRGSLRLLCLPPPPRHPSASLWGWRWTFHPQPAAHFELLALFSWKAGVIKRPFMLRAQPLWWGCHFVQCSAPSRRNLRQTCPHPSCRTDEQTLTCSPRVTHRFGTSAIIVLLWRQEMKIASFMETSEPEVRSFLWEPPSHSRCLPSPP